MTAFKAQAIARDIEQRVIAVTGATYTESYDSNGMPILLFTSKLGEMIFVKVEVEPDPANPVDSLGLPQVIYSPHQCTLLEVPFAEATDLSFRAIVEMETAKHGTKTFLYQVNPLPASYSLAGATLITTDPSDPWNPLTQSE